MTSSNNKNNNNNKTLFVTVGTTQFDKLIQAVTAPAALQWMERHNYTKLVIQHGRGPRPTLVGDTATTRRLQLRCYDFLPSLLPDLQAADLILSHAGAGTVCEVLSLLPVKRLAVVVNTDLMDNHQLELAHALERRNYLYVVESADLLLQMTADDDNDNDNDKIWNALEDFVPTPPAPTNPNSVATILNAFFQQ